MLGTIETVADLSYAWHALAGYKEAVVQGQIQGLIGIEYEANQIFKQAK